MARRHGSGGKTIDYKAWLAMAANDVVVSTAGTTISTGVLNFGAPGTILRCRGYVQAHMDATKQVDDTMGLGFGLAIVSTDASQSATPDPFADPDYPWLWWGTMFLEAEKTGGDEAWGISAQRLEVDTKAMRRVKPAQSLVWVAERATVAGAPSVNITFGATRVLIGT